MPLAPWTYMKIGGPAEVLWEAHDLDVLVEVIRFCRDRGFLVTILGGASNVLIADEGLRGLVILNRCEAGQSLPPAAARELLPVPLHGTVGDDTVILAESGIKTALLVKLSVDSGLSGLEPFLGVPGTLGGAIFNNSHYTQELIGSFVAAVEVLDDQGNRTWLSQAECEFGYDRSRFHQTKEVILRVLFSLPLGQAQTSQEKIREATVKRATTQPLGTANSGCMFRNVEVPPEKRAEYEGKSQVSAGWLIDQAGLKGYRVGSIVVSDKHANFMINEGGGSSEEVKALVQYVQAQVFEKFGVELIPEVFFMSDATERTIHANV